MKKILLCLIAISWGAQLALAEEEWKSFRSTHFEIFYKEVSLDFVKTVSESTESSYKEVSGNLGFSRYQYWGADKRAQVYIYNDSNDFVVNGRQASWSAGTTHTQSKEIRTFPTPHGFFDSTIPHELGHIIFREFIGEDAIIPLWFEEGVATYQEKAKRWGSHMIVQAALKNGEFMPLSELSAMRLTPRSEAKKVELFYAEAASIVYYLIQEQGTSRFVRLCHKIQDGVQFEEALKCVYVRFKNIDQLNKAWKDYLNK